jgi:hypothetical protein
MFYVREAADADEPIAQHLADSVFAELREIYFPTPQARARRAAAMNTFSRLVAMAARMAASSELFRIGWKVAELNCRVSRLVGINDAGGSLVNLIERIVETARSRGSKVVSLWRVLQTGNIPMFERAGFVVIRQERSDSMELASGGSATDVLMERLVD